MAFYDAPLPRSVSALDVAFLLEKSEEVGYVHTDIEGETEGSTVKVLSFVVPVFETKELDEALFKLGIDVGKTVESINVIHRPSCLSYGTRMEKKPAIYGIRYTGTERNDAEWLAFKREHRIQ